MDKVFVTSVSKFILRIIIVLRFHYLVSRHSSNAFVDTVVYMIKVISVANVLQI